VVTSRYDAQYYSYKYAEVFSADMYSVFKERGVMNGDVGRRYRDEILAPGGERDSMEGLVAFLGRRPTQDAFLRHIGLTH
jgi:Zn-dependent oligopeptidase